jgi:hypothetical protein
MPERAKATPAEGARATPAAAQPAHAGTQPGAGLANDGGREAVLAGGHAVASLEGASGTGDPPEFRMTPNGVLGLQRAVGNRAVNDVLTSVQRVPVKVSGGETLYNQGAAGGQSGAAHYVMGGQYDMTRQGDSGVTVIVKIRFVRQTRNTMPFNPPAQPAQVGDLVGPKTVLPAGDQAWATNMMGQAVKHWDGKLTLVGEEWNAFKKNTIKRLPVTFQAVPVFTLDGPADQEVVVHPPGVLAQGASKGSAIDAGNFYMKKDDSVYPAADNIIYAHEYGHLLGIPDEYSQSNEQMNQLIHKAAPDKAASNMKALDRKSVEKMALAALANPLYGQLQSTMAAVTGAIRAERRSVKAAMAKAAREGARTAEVREQLKKQLEMTSEAKLSPRIPGVAAFQTMLNFSNRDIADQSVEAGFATAALTKQIGDAYWKALSTEINKNVAVTGFGDVRVIPAKSVYTSTGSGQPLAGQASTIAQQTVGQTGPGLPAMPPSATLTAQLANAPATWKAAGAGLATSITGANFSTKMKAALAAAQAAAAAPPPPGMAPAAKTATARELYNKAHTLVTNAAREAARQLAAELVDSTLTPILTASVNSLQGTVATEVTRLMTSSPAQLAANPAPDPNMAAIVANMKTRLDASKTGLKGTGMDPLGVSGATSPAQDVTYSYQGLMGSNATAALRADQFQGLADAFNKKLASFWEKKFKPEVK